MYDDTEHYREPNGRGYVLKRAVDLFAVCFGLVFWTVVVVGAYELIVAFLAGDIL